ncbi:MAG: N-6 DNA methylase [Brevinematales bacterium]|nr:N-6 DNA methylase [Brevinematales bacterium]
MSAGRSVNSQSQDWCTPPKYVNAVKEMYNGVIELDPCGSTYSIVGAKTEFILPFFDGLKEEWNYKNVYVNPPYGADRIRGTTIKDWLKKCAETNQKYHSEVLALVPVATNTAHWKHYVFGKASSVCFLYDTRLKFIINGSTDNKGAPMSCCMLYWGSNIQRFKDIFMKYGAVVNISDLIGEKAGYFCTKDNQSLFSETKDDLFLVK